MEARSGRSSLAGCSPASGCGARRRPGASSRSLQTLQEGVGGTRGRVPIGAKCAHSRAGTSRRGSLVQKTGGPAADKDVEDPARRARAA